MAGGLFGQVLGVAIGGAVAATHGWRMAFAAIGVAGLVLGLLYPVVVRESRIRKLAGHAATDEDKPTPPPLRELVGNRSVRFAYIASGLQLFAGGALPAWLPSYFNRYYHLPVDRAGSLAAVLLLISGVGMILCGALSDRLSQDRPENKIALSICYSVGTALCLALAMQLPPGTAQLIALGLAMFLVAGTVGPVGAMVANLTPLAIHGSAFATLTLANNFLGLAQGVNVGGVDEVAALF